jgi:hypothetical protein
MSITLTQAAFGGDDFSDQRRAVPEENLGGYEWVGGPSAPVTEKGCRHAADFAHSQGP